MKEYELYIPTYYNDRRPVGPEKFDSLQEILLQQFGGVTYFSVPNSGLWRMADVVYRDEVVIYRVITSEAKSARRFFELLKQQLKVELEQEEILIVERDVRTL
ncbi:MAG TPA: hypothetical protein VEK15_21455 [Vicinamibacteria bacterium]|nr:hypothetical protein [Vicinamibacteria bacterium]